MYKLIGYAIVYLSGSAEGKYWAKNENGNWTVSDCPSVFSYEDAFKYLNSETSDKKIVEIYVKS